MKASEHQVSGTHYKAELSGKNVKLGRPMSANDKQVGGTHYKSSYAHWDYCIETNVPNLEYAASKYVLRWRKKNGLVDLEKAKHYIEKRLECFNSYRGILRAANKKPELFEKMCEANGSTPKEKRIMDDIMHWKAPVHLVNALIAINQLIVENTPEEGEATSAYVNQDR